MRSTIYIFLVLLMVGCTVAGKLERKLVAPTIVHTSKQLRDKVKIEEEQKAANSLITVVDSATGKGMIFGDKSNTIVGEDGQKMAVIDIQSISIKSHSRMLPERNGAVDIDFLVMLPSGLQGESQSITITPYLLRGDNHEPLEPLQIRGGLFSKLQERNYWRYAKYRDLLQAKYGGGEMSKEDSASLKNVFEEYVRYPYLDRTRLDSISSGGNTLTYHYRQNVKVEDDVKKMRIILEGKVFALDGSKYILPVNDTLQFNLSSMLAFVDTSSRYLMRVVEKFAVVNDRNYLTFKVNNTNIVDTMASNKEQLAKIKSLMNTILMQGEFNVDSIVLTATSSPEGGIATNERLAKGRAHSLADYLRKEFDFPELDTILNVRWQAEDWVEFEKLVTQKASDIPNAANILEIIQSSGDADKRERKIKDKYPVDYKYILANIYPSLRAVNFKYSLTRVGMVKDTIHTTELDTAYMRGVELLKMRQYQKAHELLFSSRTQNSAVALLSLGFNRSAYEVLMDLQPTPIVEYLRAIVCSRLGYDEQGRECFNRAVEQQPSLEFRGRLDPEITAIVKFD